MSFLLDALRKSEQQRRLGETPRIQVPTLGQTDQAHRPARRWWLALGVLLIAVLSVLLVLQQSGKNDAAEPGQAAGDFAAELPESQPAQPPAQPAAQPAVQLPQIDPAPAAGNQAPPVSDHSLPSALSENNLEQPVKDFDALAAEIAEREAEARQARQAAAIAAVQNEPEKDTAAAIPPVEQSMPEIEDDEPEWQPQRPSHISYFELPVNIRQQLPELPISIRVYDEAPEKRFVIINRGRVTEGDSIPEASEVKLVEIKRDSLILEFQGYVFEYQ